MAPRRAADVFDEVAKLLAQGNQDLVLVLDRLCITNVMLEPRQGNRLVESDGDGSIAKAEIELLLTVEEGDQLISCSLGAEGKSNCREPVNRVESEQNIVVLGRSRELKSASRHKKRDGKLEE